ncbi:hypothetical protein [Lentilactobacillus kosonis]|uniref:Uncharacterized protein n=1 Tax=Lentilactobacillus kosonis TaxID=2810561 RepID=A0A401FHW9_9LACO|nr:hypothetical protein [Lentilactobacillus kosonis]GAY71942.1 hypothetical protein NBRC111893_88 [Lentilactobacillus kosonis]
MENKGLIVVLITLFLSAGVFFVIPNDTSNEKPVSSKNGARNNQKTEASSDSNRLSGETILFDKDGHRVPLTKNPE